MEANIQVNSITNSAEITKKIPYESLVNAGSVHDAMREYSNLMMKIPAGENLAPLARAMSESLSKLGDEQMALSFMLAATQAELAHREALVKSGQAKAAIAYAEMIVEASKRMEDMGVILDPKLEQ